MKYNDGKDFTYAVANHFLKYFTENGRMSEAEISGVTPHSIKSTEKNISEKLKIKIDNIIEEEDLVGPIFVVQEKNQTYPGDIFCFKSNGEKYNIDCKDANSFMSGFNGSTNKTFGFNFVPEDFKHVPHKLANDYKQRLRDYTLNYFKENPSEIKRVMDNIINKNGKGLNQLLINRNEVEKETYDNDVDCNEVDVRVDGKEVVFYNTKTDKNIVGFYYTYKNYDNGISRTFPAMVGWHD